MTCDVIGILSLQWMVKIANTSSQNKKIKPLCNFSAMLLFVVFLVGILSVYQTELFPRNCMVRSTRLNLQSILSITLDLALHKTTVRYLRYLVEILNNLKIRNENRILKVMVTSMSNLWTQTC